MCVNSHKYLNFNNVERREKMMVHQLIKLLKSLLNILFEI